MSRLAILWVLVTGCYASHGVGDRRDAAPVPAPDLGPRSPDLGPPSDCRTLVVLDRDRSPWESLDCGPVTAAATVVRAGAFDQIARESPETCGRSPLVAARQVRGGGALALGEDRVILDAHPAARGLAAAVQGSTLVVGTGVEWSAYTGAYEATDAGELGRVPESVPGCPFRLDVMDLLPRPTGWFATFDYFECDVDGGQHRFYESERLTPSSELETVWPGIGGAAPHENGALVVGRARPGVETRLLWIDEPALTPREQALDASGSAVAVGHWDRDATVLAFLDGAAVTMVVLGRDGAVRDRSTTALPGGLALEAYGPSRIEVATTDFGALVGIELEWLGGRIDSGYVVMGFDRQARPLLGALVEVDLGTDRAVVSMAGAGDEALASVFSGTIEETTAESILIGCSP